MDDCRDVIYRKASKQKKLTSATLEVFNVLPQVKQLDADFAKGIDGAYRIKRVKTYEDFVAMCCEFYVDPVSYQNSLCYIVESDDGYSYLMVVERDNSVANFGVGFSTVMTRATQGGASANYAYCIGRAMYKMMDDVNSKFGVKRKTKPRTRFIL